MKLRALVACAGVMCVLSGCATNKKWGKGTAAGALIGGSIGGLAGAGMEYGRDKDEATQLGRGAAIGVAAGMIIGGLVGHILWDQETGAAAAAAPAPAPPATAEVPEFPPPTERKVVLRSVRFDFNKAVIRLDDVPVLDEAVRTLQEQPKIPITIEGHTDNVGSRDYNLFLGHKRAMAVRNYLVDHGIASQRLVIRTLDADEPVASNDTEEGRAQNRRVELKLQGGE